MSIQIKRRPNGYVAMDASPGRFSHSPGCSTSGTVRCDRLLLVVTKCRSIKGQLRSLSLQITRNSVSFKKYLLALLLNDCFKNFRVFFPSLTIIIPQLSE